MKVALMIYLDEQNGLTLSCTGETEVEKTLLKGFGRFGKLCFRDDRLLITAYDKPADNSVSFLLKELPDAK